MHPIAFESYIAHLLSKKGFSAKVTPPSRNFGTDFLASKNGVQYVGQCKRYSSWNKVTSEMMQQCVGSMKIYGVEKGIYVTTSTFTPDEKKLGKKHGVTLIDQDELCTTIKKRFGKDTPPS